MTELWVATVKWCQPDTGAPAEERVEIEAPENWYVLRELLDQGKIPPCPHTIRVERASDG